MSLDMDSDHLPDTFDYNNETFWNPLGFHLQDNYRLLSQTSAQWDQLPQHFSSCLPPHGLSPNAVTPASMTTAQGAPHPTSDANLEAEQINGLADTTTNAIETDTQNDLGTSYARTHWQPPRRSANQPLFVRRDSAPTTLDPIDQAICALWMTQNQCSMPSERTIASLGNELETSTKVLRQWFENHAVSASEPKSSRKATSRDAGDIVDSLCTLWIIKKSAKMPDDLTLASLGHAFSCSIDKLRLIFAGIVYQDPVYHTIPVPIIPCHDVEPRNEAPPLSRKNDKSNPYACTFGCGWTFAQKGMWKRHESTHCRQREWRCKFEVCASSASRGRRFSRREHLVIHISKEHPHMNLSKDDIQTCRVATKTQFDKRCVFKKCNVRFDDWDQRIDHIAEHFKKPWHMSQWRKVSQR